jgi:uncharacterized protein (TIGR00730 family)
VKTVCVFTGSRPGARPAYAQAAAALANELVARDIAAVYGGGSVGMMGALADAMLARGGRVIGVIPEALEVREKRHVELTELHVVSSMHERKAIMNDLADGFVVLPGGLGTMDELFEMWTWVQLGFIAKPVGLLNVEGYFEPLLAFVDRAVVEGFVDQSNRDMIVVADDPGSVLDAMRDYAPPRVTQWLDRDTT